MTLTDLAAVDMVLPKHRITHPNERAVERCRTFLLERLEPNGTLASYLSATVLMVFALQALGYSNHHPTVVRAVVGLKDMVYRGKSLVHQQFFTSTVWDASLSMQALTAAGVSSTHVSLTKGLNYLISKQQHRVSDWIHHAPNASPGGFGFSHINTLYPDIDDTTAAVKALYPYWNKVRSQWKRAMKWMLAMQNDDGGWSAFDRNCDKQLLGFLFDNDLSGTWTDPSTPNITGRVLGIIGHVGIHNAGAIPRALKWLLDQQHDDGSWMGRWGIAFIYGTWAAVLGLRSAGVQVDNPSIQKALSWMEGIQNHDGGFGESCRSDEREIYIPLKQSTASQTAWALMGMLASSSKITPHIERAAKYLVETARPNGGWKETYPTGAGIAGHAYIRYHSYPYVWPLLALCVFRKKARLYHLR